MGWCLSEFCVNALEILRKKITYKINYNLPVQFKEPQHSGSDTAGPERALAPCEVCLHMVEGCPESIDLALLGLCSAWTITVETKPRAIPLPLVPNDLEVIRVGVSCTVLPSSSFPYQIKYEVLPSSVTSTSFHDASLLREEPHAHPLTFYSRESCLYSQKFLKFLPCSWHLFLDPKASTRLFIICIFSIHYCNMGGGDMSSCLECEWLVSINSQFSLLLHFIAIRNRIVIIIFIPSLCPSLIGITWKISCLGRRIFIFIPPSLKTHWGFSSNNVLNCI